MFFSYDHEDGIEFHDTAEAAKARAEKALEMDRDIAIDGWPENVDDSCWGEVRGKVVETMRRRKNECDICDSDEIVEYELIDTTNQTLHHPGCSAAEPR